MIKREADIQSPLYEIKLAKVGCRSALAAAYQNSPTSDIFYHFITAASAQLPDSILFRREGPKGLIQLKGNDRPSPKETCNYFLPKSFEIYVFNQEGYRPTSRIYLPGDDNFVGIRGIRRKGLPLHPFFDQQTGRSDFKQIQEIVTAIGINLESIPTLNNRLSFRCKDLTSWIQACQEVQGDILDRYGRKIKELVPNLRDVIMESSESVRLPSVISHIKNNHDPYDTTEYYFIPRELRLVSKPRDTRKHRFFKHLKKPYLSRVVDTPVACWYGAIDDITDGLLSVLPPRWIAALKSRY